MSRKSICRTFRLANPESITIAVQDWPLDCRWSKASGHCRGRAPAPMERIIRQLQLAAKVLEPQQRAQIVAWEWTSCLR